MKATETALENKLEGRKKQFNVLVKSILELQTLLDEDGDSVEAFEKEPEENVDESMKLS